MTSPNPPHTVKVEIFVGGAWVDISADMYQRTPAQITRGANSESSSIQPGSCVEVLDNRAKNYSFRNPNSIYYGQLKRNTPFRISGASTLRMWGEIASGKPSADQSGKDLNTTLTVGGLLRRLLKSGPVPKSTPASYYPTTSPRIYWPMEEGPLSTSATPTVGTGQLYQLGTGGQNWGQGTLADWLPLGLTGVFQSGLDGSFLAPLPTTGFSVRWDLDFIFNTSAFTGSQSWEIRIYQDPNLSSSNYWSLLFTPTLGHYTVTPPSGVSGAQTVDANVADNLPHHCRFSVGQNGSFAQFTVSFDGAQSVQANSGVLTVTAPLLAYLGTTSGSITPSVGVTIGHMAYFSGDFISGLAPTLSTAASAAFGYQGEAAGTRIARLCSENSITCAFVGTSSATRPLGPQRALGIVDLLNEAADADGGYLYESIAALGLVYITRDAMYNASVALALTYTTNHHLATPLDPPEDDLLVVNDATVTRVLGGSSRVQRTTGSLSNQASPTGVGPYTKSVTLNVLTQDQALQQAGWITFVGTWDEARYPTITINLSVLPLALRANALAVTIGSRITIDSPPAWLPPDQIDLLVVGVQETLNRFRWDLILICIPYGPYRVGVWDSSSLGRLSSDGSTVTCTAGAASWSVVTPSGPLWTTAAGDFPLDFRVEGEKVTVTNITGGTSPQTFTVTRSVNGIVKAHTAAAVELWQPMIWAM